MRIIYRYIWNDFFQQFLVCVLGFTALGIGKVIFDYNDLFIGYHVTLELLGRLLLNQLPALWMDVFPAAALFGVILSLGRFLRERELDVIQLCGVGPLKASLPIFVGVTLICIGTYCWNDLVVPSANHRFQTELRRLSMQEDLPLFKENVVFKGPQNRFIFLKNVQHKLGKISGVLIIEAGVPGKWPRLITADYGLLHKGVWELFDGVIHEIDAKGAISSELRYQKMQIKMVIDNSLMVGDEKSPSEMRAGELLHLIGLQKRSGLNNPIYTVFFYQKFADPLIALILVYLAVPLTMLTGRHSRWLGLVLCFLIIMGYYVMQVVGRTMGSNSVISPWAAVWVPHLFFLTAGFLLLLGVEQRR